MLAQKKCKSVEHAAPLDPLQIEEMMTYVPEWDLVVLAESLAIRRRFKFKNFKEALDFVKQVGELAEEQNHHPDISLGWGFAEFTLYSHDIQGLHENDFIIAAKIDQL